MDFICTGREKCYAMVGWWYGIVWAVLLAGVQRLWLHSRMCGEALLLVGQTWGGRERPTGGIDTSKLLQVGV